MASLVGSYHTDRTNTHVRTVHTYMEDKKDYTRRFLQRHRDPKDCRLSSVTVYPFSSRDNLKPPPGAICARMLFGLTDSLHVSVLFSTENEKEKKKLGSKTGPEWSFFRLACEEKTR
jgi:hypothetical protein